MKRSFSGEMKGKWEKEFLGEMTKRNEKKK
jgi:hypothetical protein